MIIALCASMFSFRVGGDMPRTGLPLLAASNQKGTDMSALLSCVITPTSCLAQPSNLMSLPRPHWSRGLATLHRHGSTPPNPAIQQTFAIGSLNGSLTAGTYCPLL